MRREALDISENSHVSTQRYLVISEATLRVHCPVGTNAINNEAVIGNRGLESLQPIP
jgi:hypothetical protein